MRNLKTVMLMIASLALTAFLGLAGCGEDHGYRVHDERAAPSPRYDNDRHEGDRHEDRGRESGHDRDEHGDR